MRVDPYWFGSGLESILIGSDPDWRRSLLVRIWIRVDPYWFRSGLESILIGSDPDESRSVFVQIRIRVDPYWFGSGLESDPDPYLSRISYTIMPRTRIIILESDPDSYYSGELVYQIRIQSSVPRTIGDIKNSIEI